MGRRGVVTDYAGDEIRKGDLVAYAARQDNRVRLTDARVEKVGTRLAAGRLIPMLKVKPTGDESGFNQRLSYRSVWVGAEHVRLILPSEADA